MLAIGCGGSVPGTQPPASSPPTVQPATTITASVEAPSRAEAPDGLFAVGRIARPGSTWKDLEESAGSGRLALRAFEPFLDLLDLNAPLDFAWTAHLRVMRMTLEPAFAASASVRLPEDVLDRARDVAWEVDELNTGVYRLRRDEGDVCFLETSAPASARLVCGQDSVDAHALAAYMARTLPGEDLGDAEGVIELRVDKLADRLGDVRSLEGLFVGWLESSAERTVPALAGALRPLLPGIASQGLSFVRDVRDVRVEVRLPHADVVELRVVTDLRASDAWVSQTLIEQAGGAVVGPDALWRLAPYSDTAWFSSSFHEGRYQQVRARLTALLASQFGAIRAPRDTADLVVRSLLPHGLTAYAHGSVPIHREAARLGGGFIRERAVSFFGWHVLAIPSPAADVDKDLAAGMRAYNDGRLRTLVYAGVPQLCAGLPPIRHRPGSIGWPRGTTSYEMQFASSFFAQCASRWGSANAASPVKPMTIVVALVPDGAQSWVGISADETKLQQVMKAAKGGGVPAPDTLLSPLATERSLAGGFLTAEAVEEGLPHVGLGGWSPSRLGGNTPAGAPDAVWWWTVSPGNDVSTTLTIRVPRSRLRNWTSTAWQLSGRSVWGRRRYPSH